MLGSSCLWRARRSEVFVSVLDERGPVDLLLIMAGTYYVARNGSWLGASKDPGPRCVKRHSGDT